MVANPKNGTVHLANGWCKHNLESLTRKDILELEVVANSDDIEIENLELIVAPKDDDDEEEYEEEEEEEEEEETNL